MLQSHLLAERVTGLGNGKNGKEIQKSPGESQRHPPNPSCHALHVKFQHHSEQRHYGAPAPNRAPNPGQGWDCTLGETFTCLPCHPGSSAGMPGAPVLTPASIQMSPHHQADGQKEGGRHRQSKILRQKQNTCAQAQKCWHSPHPITSPLCVPLALGSWWAGPTLLSPV